MNIPVHALVKACCLGAVLLLAAQCAPNSGPSASERLERAEHQRFIREMRLESEN